MIIYNPHNTIILELRIKEAEELLAQIPAQYCFITGSFLYKKKYRDSKAIRRIKARGNPYLFISNQSENKSCKRKKQTQRMSSG